MDGCKGWANLVLPLGMMAAALFTGIAADDVLTRQAMAEKLEFYRVDYPKFNHRDAEMAAATAFPLVKEGDPVNITGSFGIIRGVFGGVSGGEAQIGSERVRLSELTTADRELLDPAECEKRRLDRVRELFQVYSRKRAADIAAYKKQLEAQYHLVPDAPAPVVESPPAVNNVPIYGMAVNNLLTASGMVKSGDVLRNVRKSGIGRYAFETADDRTVTADAANVYIFTEINSLNTFEITQSALALLVKDRLREAVYYALLADGIGENRTRAETIMTAVQGFWTLQTAIRSGNERIAALNKELETQVGLLTSNQNLLLDEFAVKAGTRDRSSLFAGKILILREKRKAVQQELKEKIRAFANAMEMLQQHTMAGGDYIAACILTVFTAEHLEQSVAAADALWQPDELTGFQNWIAERKNDVSREYQTRIARPFKDGWTESLDRYVALFGYNEKDLSQLDIKPDFNSLLAAARDSFRYSGIFAKAAATDDFSTAFWTGMRVLTLLPNPGEADFIMTWINTALSRFEAAPATIAELAKRREWHQVMIACSRLHPLPTPLAALRATAQREIAAAEQAGNQAAAAEKRGDYDEAERAVLLAMDLCRDEPKSGAFAVAFQEQHRELLYRYHAYKAYFDRCRYVEALSIWREMNREMPQYTPFLRKMRLQLEAGFDESSRNLLQADNYFQAGRYDEALALYEKYDHHDGIMKVYSAQLQRAEARQDWKSAVHYLELLGRWNDAGEMRRKHNLP